MSLTGDASPRFLPALTDAATVAHLSAGGDRTLCGVVASAVTPGTMVGYLAGLPRCRSCQRRAEKALRG